MAINVAMRVDADDIIGGGHAVRCMAIAESLVARHAQVHVFTSQMRPDLITAFRSLGVFVHHLSSETLGDTVEDQRLAGMAFVGALRCANVSPQWVLVDHYCINAPWHAAVRQSGCRIACIDDLGNRRLECELVVYPLLAPPKHGYAALTPDDCTRLLGPEFALLSRSYRQQPVASEQTRRTGPVVVSFGLADPHQLTEQTVAILADEISSDVRVEAVAPHGESQTRLAAMQLPASIRVIGPQPSLAPLLATARMAVGGAGGTSIERIFFRVPTIAIPLVANQEWTARFLAEEGLATVVTPSSPTFHDDYRAALRSAVTTTPQFPANGLRIDGLGAERVARHLLN